jgi:hypothetical protein
LAGKWTFSTNNKKQKQKQKQNKQGEMTTSLQLQKSVVKAFQLQGLVLKVDATKYVISLLADAQNQDALLRNLLTSLATSHRKLNSIKQSFSPTTLLNKRLFFRKFSQIPCY